jgi:adenosine kinase
VKALIVTKGGEGSEIRANGQRYDIPCVQADEVIDPTGCGDAYRSGLLYGIANGFDWVKTGQSGGGDGSNQDCPSRRSKSPAQP